MDLIPRCLFVFRFRVDSIGGHEADLLFKHIRVLGFRKRMPSLKKKRKIQSILRYGETGLDFAFWYARRDSNPQPSEPESDALSVEPLALTGRYYITRRGKSNPEKWKQGKRKPTACLCRCFRDSPSASIDFSSNLHTLLLQIAKNGTAFRRPASMVTYFLSSI